MEEVEVPRGGGPEGVPSRCNDCAVSSHALHII